MIDKTKEIKSVVQSIKRSLASLEEIVCISQDIIGTELKPERYSDDLYLYRDEDDKFIYIHDNGDNSSGRLDLSTLKIIIDNIAKRWVEDKFEREELENFLNTEEAE